MTIDRITDHDPRTQTQAGVFERQHLVYLGIAYGFSWLFWIGAWLITRSADAGDQLINADLAWALFFEGEGVTAVVWLSLLSLVGVWGPMIAGVVATRIDPTTSSGQLRSRVGRVGISLRWYGLALGILALVAGPAALIVSITADRVPGAPAGGTVLAFLAVFFVFQMLTSGTEEIGWRGYLNEKLMRGRNFYETGWAVGLPWAVWHVPIVLIIFAQQGMEPVAMVGSLAGFGIGIVAVAILHAWFYERTRSVFLSIFIHAAFNTLPLATTLLYENSPVAVIANLSLWAVVIYLKRRHDKEALGEMEAVA